MALIYRGKLPEIEMNAGVEKGIAFDIDILHEAMPGGSVVRLIPRGQKVNPAYARAIKKQLEGEQMSLPVTQPIPPRMPPGEPDEPDKDDDGEEEDDDEEEEEEEEKRAFAKRKSDQTPRPNKSVQPAKSDKLDALRKAAKKFARKPAKK